MDFLLAQDITETTEVQTKPEEPTGGGVKEEISIPVPSSPPPIRSLDTYSGPLMPVPKLPMGTIIETITIPATVPTPPTSAPPIQQRKMNIQGVTEEVKQEPSGYITIKREICDGEVQLGPFKSCLKEFTGVPAVGWIAAAAGLIVLWKWLEWRFKK